MLARSDVLNETKLRISLHRSVRLLQHTESDGLSDDSDFDVQPGDICVAAYSEGKVQ